MNNVLPFTTNPQRLRKCQDVKLVNCNSSAATGPTVTARQPNTVTYGVLTGWDSDAAAAYNTADQPPEVWDMGFGDREEYFERHVQQCANPEEVEELLPSKWIGYKVQTDSDDTLARVCKLCTALVNRFIALAEGDAADKSTSKWREHQELLGRLRSVMELLEASIGEAIPILKLGEPKFVKDCWNALQDDERVDVVSLLTQSEQHDYTF